MSGGDWERFANLRLLFGYMYAQPGKKLLFMGDEFAQWDEWWNETSLAWHLAPQPPHAGVQRWVGDLNRVYRDVPALHQRDFSPDGFEWVDADDSQQSVLSFLRKSPATNEAVLAICNFTPIPRLHYRVGVPGGGFWKEILNSDATAYGGLGHGNLGGQEARAVPCHGRPFSLDLTLPPLAALFFKGPSARGSAPVS